LLLPAQTSAELSSKEIAAKALPAVVTIEVFNEKSERTGHGSGFIVRPDGIVITNYHVIDKAHFARAERSNGDKLDVRSVIEFDRQRPLAISKGARCGSSHTVREQFRSD